MINYQYFVLLFSGMCTYINTSHKLPPPPSPTCPQTNHIQPLLNNPQKWSSFWTPPPPPPHPPPTPNKHYISSKPVRSITMQSCAWQCREPCPHCTQLQAEISGVGDSPTDLREGERGGVGGGVGSFPRAGGACPTHTWLVRFHPNLSLSQQGVVERWFWPQGSIPPQLFG